MSNRFLNKKNVVGYGPGIKRVAGKKTGEDALIFFVEKKTNDISDKDRIPERVDGVKTDVFEVGKITPKLLTPCNTAVMNKTITPLRGSITIGDSAALHMGTLGAIVKDRTTGKLLAITNSHVAGCPLVCTTVQAAQLTAAGFNFIDGPTAVGLEMYQSVLPNGNLFGEVVKDHSRSCTIANKLDTALISIKSSIGVTPGIMGLTKYAQSFVHPGTTPVGTSVLKAGRTSGVTHGEILSMSAVITAQHGPIAVPYENQIIVHSENMTTPFLDSGDSGAMLTVDLGDGRVGLIGNLHAGSDVDGTGSISVAARLDEIVDALDIRPWTGEIIASSGYPDVVSTPFGAVFTRDSSTFLSVTNDYVCDGTVCGIIPMNVLSSYHAHSSIDIATLLPDLTLKYTQLFITADCDADVELAITMDSDTGAVADASVPLQIALDAVATITTAVNMDATVNVRASLESVVAIGEGVTADCDSTIYLSVEGESTAVITIGASADALVPILVSLDAVAETTLTVGADCDADVFMAISSDSVANITAIDYGAPGGDVPDCDAVNAADLCYGGTI